MTHTDLHPRTPFWLVASGGCALAAGAAATNVAFLAACGISVSHMTGDLTRIPWEILGQGHGAQQVLGLVVVCISFTLGAMLAGLLMHRRGLDLGRPYGAALALEGLLLGVAWLLLARWPVLALGLAAGACGLQNALASTWRGVLLRTTHVTGLLTDFGQGLGIRLGGGAVPAWRLGLHAALLLAFAAGAVLGALAWREAAGLLLPGLACGYLIAGVVAGFLRRP